MKKSILLSLLTAMFFIAGCVVQTTASGRTYVGWHPIVWIIGGVLLVFGILSR